jgi:hypothetical protein
MGAPIWTCYEYHIRMISAWVSGATTTYAYNHTVSRVRQTSSTTTTHYSSKCYYGSKAVSQTPRPYVPAKSIPLAGLITKSVTIVLGSPLANGNQMD